MSAAELLDLLRPLETESYFGQLNTLFTLMMHHFIQADQALKANNLSAARIGDWETGRYRTELEQQLSKYKVARDAIMQHRPKLLQYMPIDEGQEWNSQVMAANIRAVIGELLSESNAAQPQAVLTNPGRANHKNQPHKKNNHNRDNANDLLIAVITKHHRYADGGCLHTEPIGNNKLARLANVAKSTASKFFRCKFREYRNYRIICRDTSRLVNTLKMLNNEISPHIVLGNTASRIPSRTDEDE